MPMPTLNGQRVRVPRPRWGGSWLTGLTDLAPDLPEGSEWTIVTSDYGPTSAYQIARSLNLASLLPEGRFEFGSVPSGDHSILVVRRLP